MDGLDRTYHYAVIIYRLVRFLVCGMIEFMQDLNETGTKSRINIKILYYLLRRLSKCYGIFVTN